MFTGKNKEQFEKWLSEWYLTWLKVSDESFSIEQKVKMFSTHLPFSMQQGVYLEYLDSVGLIVERQTYYSRMAIWDYRTDEPSEEILIDCTYCENQQEALTEAFKKADELINKI